MDQYRSLLGKLSRSSSAALRSKSARLKATQTKLAKRRGRKLRMESLESRRLMAVIAATGSGGDWNNTSTWVGGVVPTASDRVIIGQGKTVNLAGTSQVAKEIVVQGQLVAKEGSVGSPTKSLTADWIHVNSGGVFQIGTQANRFDNHDFVLTLTGTNPNADFTVETATGTTSAASDGSLDRPLVWGFSLTGTATDRRATMM